MKIDNFIVLESVYGKFVVTRTCLFQSEALVKTGRTHIEDELRNIFAIIATLPDNAIIVDGGTNIGFFSIPVAHMTQDRNIKIIGFEPQRQLFQALGGSLALNGYRNVYLHKYGLGAAQGIAEMPEVDYSTDQDFGQVSLSDKSTVKEHSWMNDRTVNITSIDSMNLPRLDFLKLDVEGYEAQALTGALNTIQKYRPWLWVEYCFTGVDTIKQTLSNLDDYVFYIVDYQNMLIAPRERLANITTVGLQQV